MLRRMYRILCAISIVLSLGSCVLHGQDATARITGHVTDPDGGVIPGAKIQVVNQENFAKREATTDAVGSYVVLALPPGRYQVIVEADGFNRNTSGILSLVPGQTATYNARLSVTSVKQELEVSGENEQSTIETDTASLSTTLGQQEVTGYGLNGRNFSQLITMAPGVSNQTGQDEAKVGVAGSGKFSVNGGRVEYNTFEVDGSDVLNTSINASRGQGEPLMVYPSIDAIQEMKVLTADYSALHGKSASGSVLVTTKSGTDKFHGNVYGFLRNEMFNTRNFFDQPDPVPQGYTGKRIYRTPLYRRIDAGATFGGPLIIPHLYEEATPRTFFFYSEEVRREKTPVDYNQAVPTEAERNGDFSDICPTLGPGSPVTFDPTKYPDCPQGAYITGSPRIGRTVVVDPLAKAVLDSGIIPFPNASSGCNSTNPSPLPHCYVAAVSPATHWREEMFRIDHDLTAKDRLSFRYIHDAWDTVTLAPQWGVVHNSFPTVENQLNGPGLNMVVSLAQQLPHGFANLLSASYEVEHISLVPQPGPGVSSLTRPAVLNASCGDAETEACPMGFIFSNGYGGNKLPGLVFQGNNGAYGGHGFAADTGYAPWNQANPTFNLRDDASKSIGKHLLQFGFVGRFVQQNEVSAVSGANSGDLQGLLTFSNQQSTNTTGNAFADFLSGMAIKSFTQDSGQYKYYSRVKEAELYVQDDWRIHPRLTINAGFRASLFGAWYNPRNSAYNWRPENFSASTGASIYVDPRNGYLVEKASGLPVPLDRSGGYSLSSLNSAVTNGLLQCGVSGVPDSCMSNSIFYPAPRVGFSWAPLGQRQDGYSRRLRALLGTRNRLRSQRRLSHWQRTPGIE